VKSDKGINPRKDGSLQGDQPQGTWKETLGHRAAMTFVFGRNELAV
jgi:hypothetical protein